MPIKGPSATNMALRRRLLQDIAELQANPYPNIVLHMQDDDLQKACLLLTPNMKDPLHLTVIFGEDYPLKAPTVTIESEIDHPNVFGSYICASILNTSEGYTAAYTSKSIAIQLLSFFSSERIEQEGGGYSVELANYNRYPVLAGNTDRNDEHRDRRITDRDSTYHCSKCGFGGFKILDKDLVIVDHTVLPNPFTKQGVSSCELDTIKNAGTSPVVPSKRDHSSMETDEDQREMRQRQIRLIDRILALPNEILLLVLGEMDTGDLLAGAKVCSKIGDFMTSYDTIRMREVQCFCIKKNFLSAKLGVGVHLSYRKNAGTLESEFDFLSQQAFVQFKIRRSIQGLGFEHWLPLPISRRHWRSVKEDVSTSLSQLAMVTGISDGNDVGGSNSKVVYNFMNNVVVKLSREAEKTWGGNLKSTLTHASEKAIESYFSLFHLLLCLATEHGRIVGNADRCCLRFLEGHTSKDDCPDLGQLLVAVLISEEGLTEDLTLAIIKEAILRNVVWMLDRKGAGMAELSYIEPSAVSNYRLQRTFEASKVSYRLLMFLALFYKNARIPGKFLSEICDEMFDAHGAPPKGAAEKLAAEIRKIHTIKTFPEFFEAMGLKDIPSKENFCTFLKKTIGDSVNAGYSSQPISQWQALAIRQMKGKEPEVEEVEGADYRKVVIPNHGFSFFPCKRGKGRR